MRKREVKFIIILSIITFPIISGCSAGREITKPEFDTLALTPTETLLVMQAATPTAMSVVKNNASAGDAFLRTKALPVKKNDKTVGHLAARMLSTVVVENGVGIAAPQVGINRRVILVQRLDIEPEKPFKVYLNPKIVEYSKETALDWEGCLSIPEGFGKVQRAKSVSISYLGENGAVNERISGFTARIFQHEIDHLDGILFIDRKEPESLIPEEEYREIRRKEKEAQIKMQTEDKKGQ